MFQHLSEYAEAAKGNQESVYATDLRDEPPLRSRAPYTTTVALHVRLHFIGAS